MTVLIDRHSLRRCATYPSDSGAMAHISERLPIVMRVRLREGTRITRPRFKADLHGCCLSSPPRLFVAGHRTDEMAPWFPTSAHLDFPTISAATGPVDITLDFGGRLVVPVEQEGEPMIVLTAVDTPYEWVFRPFSFVDATYAQPRDTSQVRPPLRGSTIVGRASAMSRMSIPTNTVHDASTGRPLDPAAMCGDSARIVLGGPLGDIDRFRLVAFDGAEYALVREGAGRKAEPFVALPDGLTFDGHLVCDGTPPKGKYRYRVDAEWRHDPPADFGRRITRRTRKDGGRSTYWQSASIPIE